jgi:hypothetical protein
MNCCVDWFFGSDSRKKPDDNTGNEKENAADFGAPDGDYPIDYKNDNLL